MRFTQSLLGSIDESTHWMLLHRPVELARRTRQNESQLRHTIAFLADESDQLAGSQPWGTNLLRNCPAFRRQSQRVGPLLRSRRNSRSSTGAPLSRIIATVTPSEGEFGAVRISFPSIAA